MPYPLFDRDRLHLKSLDERVHDMSLSDCLHLDDPVPAFESNALEAVIERVVAAHRRARPVILMMGAHVIKVGLSRFLIDMLERGLITHLAMNGACVIHDFELALVGATTESVARYIREGQFGLWEETAQINDVINRGAEASLGLGEAVGKVIEEEKFPHWEISVLAAAYRLHVPATVHVGIGADIIHEHPNCDGAALGAASYRDFLILAHTLCALQDGVLLNVGTAVTGPEVFLKALAMARNVAHQEGQKIDRFTTAVFDIQDLGPDYHRTPPKHDPRYYFRFLKTNLIRTVQDGGESFYVQGNHLATVPNLYRGILERLEENDG